MTAVSYYGGLRPSEVVMLRRRVLDLQLRGWGRIEVVEANIDVDEPGEPKTGPRSVPIPPVLVVMLRSWVDEHDFAPEDLIFRTRNGCMPTKSNWCRLLDPLDLPRPCRRWSSLTQTGRRWIDHASRSRD